MKKIGVLLLALLMTFSCTEEILKPDVDNQLKSKVIEKEAITAAKDWFILIPKKTIIICLNM